MAGHVSHRLAGARAGYRARFSHRLAMPLYWGKAPSHWFQALVWHVQKGVYHYAVSCTVMERPDTIEPRDTPTAQEQVTANPKK